jgi:SAM-dependent methyltransferase
MVPYLFLSRFLSLLELPFFAKQDTGTPLRGSLTQIVMSLAVTIPLAAPLGIYALPMGRSVSYLCASAFLTFLLHRKFGVFGFATLWRPVLKILSSAIALAVFTLLGLRLAEALQVPGAAGKLVAIVLPFLTGFGALVFALTALGILTPEMLQCVLGKRASVFGQTLRWATDRIVKKTRSGEYILPGAMKLCFANCALGIAKHLPGPVRDEFLKRGAYYQVFEQEELGDKQGLSINKWNAIKMPSSLKGSSVLDIGCADGFFCELCAKHGATSVLGIDGAFGRLLRARFHALKGQLNINYRAGIFPNLGVRTKFDYVLCLSVLHHAVSQKNIWKVITKADFPDDLRSLRKHLAALRTLTADKGKCIIEIPYEYQEPSERQEVDFELFSQEVKLAGFAQVKCLGKWEHNPKYRESKDRVIYIATPAQSKGTEASAESINGSEFPKKICTWCNGHKAVVHLEEFANGWRQVVKHYKRGFSWWMWREYLNVSYLGKKLDIVPKLIRFRPWRRELVVTYVAGQRVLEWVLERFGEKGLKMDEFLNFEPMGTDPRVRKAFNLFCRSESAEAVRLKKEISRSYATLHSIGWQHGTCDPRNLIFDGYRVYIIDFDHARPGFSPGRYDFPPLKRWFGVVPERFQKNTVSKTSQMRVLPVSESRN